MAEHFQIKIRILYPGSGVEEYLFILLSVRFRESLHRVASVFIQAY